MTSETLASARTSSIESSIAGRIDQLRQMQAELRTRPVTGSLPGLKKLVYKIIRSTFSRQFSWNAATVDLLETMYRELETLRPALRQQATQLQSQAQRVNAQSPPRAAITTGEVLASCGQTQDQARLNNIRALIGFNHVYTAPAEMRMPERVVLYSLVFGLQPRNCLEVGTFRGGSSAIICGALDDTGFGQLACVDPSPRVAPELWSQISHRCRMFEGSSPGILPEVARQAGGPFDFALIDADHPYECVRSDIGGVLTVLADNAYVLLHDAHSPGVKRAVDEAVAKNSALADCGLVSIEPTVLIENGQQKLWAGLRLLKFHRSHAR